MKFNVTVEGGHPAEVLLDVLDDGTFTGVVSSEEYGAGQITKGQKVGDALKGTVNLGGYGASFTALLDGNNISGQIKYGWFFRLSFSGALADSPPAPEQPAQEDKHEE